MATTEEFQRLILDFIEAEIVATSDQQIDPEENLFVSGHVDSMGIMRLVAHLETALALEIPPTDLVPENFRTVRVMAEYLSRSTAAESR